MASLISTITDATAYHTHVVYVLTHPELQHVYYGCTSQGIEARFQGHLSELEDGVHHNKLLQDLYDAGFKEWATHQVATGLKGEMLALESELYMNDHLCVNLGNKCRKQSARVTYDEVQLVIAMHKQGYMNRQIAAKLNRSRDTIHHILKGSYESLNHTN